MITAESDKILERYKPWLWAVAYGISENHAPDLVQEGMIAGWRALQTHDASRGPLDYWIKYKARGRMLDVVVRHTWTGATTPGTRRYEPEQTAVDTTDPVVHELLGTVDLGEIQLAYHHGEIHAALRELSPADREYVYRRFWKLEVLPRHDRWGRIKPKLQQSLAHLVEV